jgi:two-component system response regulator HupR/HoxA
MVKLGLLESPDLEIVWTRDLKQLREAGPLRLDAIVVDVSHPDELDARFGHGVPDGTPLLVCLPCGAAHVAPAALALGASDVTVAPDPHCERGAARFRSELLDRIEQLGRTSPAAPRSAVGAVAESPGMREILRLCKRAGGSRAPVLVTGETGSGKELVAREIHASSPRASRPFVAVNCAALPESLLESELFGHVRGAFTGAERDHRGLFEQASGGTLLLDELGEAPPSIQARLLRVLQEGEVRPVGAQATRPVDTRIVAATHRNLRSELRDGHFREDLYYRVAVFEIEVPPLRERRSDVLPLARHFLARHGERDAKPGCELSRAAELLLLEHRWPGNVRELENEMQRALALADAGELLTPRHLSARLGRDEPNISGVAPAAEPLRETLERIEAKLVRRALERNAGHRATTARELGITREGLYN